MVSLCRVQKNPSFLKSPTHWIFRGFIGFLALLDFSTFCLNEQLGSLSPVLQTEIELRLVRVFCWGFFNGFYPQKSDGFFWVLRGCLNPVTKSGLLSVSHRRDAPLQLEGKSAHATITAVLIYFGSTAAAIYFSSELKLQL